MIVIRQVVSCFNSLRPCCRGTSHEPPSSHFLFTAFELHVFGCGDDRGCVLRMSRRISPTRILSHTRIHFQLEGHCDSIYRLKHLPNWCIKSQMASQNATDDVSVTSSGLVAGDNPIHHSLLLLIIQVGIIICISRSLALLLRPLKQPRVVAEILGGILLGPTAFGHIPGFTMNIFPQSSLLVLETVAEIGLIFFLFLVGLELNIKQIRKSGVMTVWMAAAGIILPFGLGVIVACIIYKFLLENLGSSFGAFALFIGVALSITAFPVLARILAERKLLNTEIGQMAMSAAAMNDIVAWVLLALAVAITNSGSSSLVAVWVLLLGITFLAFMFLVVSPIMHALAHYSEPATEPVIAITLLLVLGAAFLTDLIGIHVIFGAFICGLIIPQESSFAAVLIEKVEDYVTVLFLPLYFAASGLKTHFSAINDGTAVLILILVIATACVGKVLGTFIVAKVWGVDSRKAITLGFLMNTKGLVELIVLNIGLSKGVLNQQLFAIMVVMTIVTTFMTTPIVMWLYAPARDTPPYKRRSIDCGDGKDDLRMLLCPVGSWNIPGMINMMEITRGTNYKSLQAYVLHLIECSNRLSSIRKSAVSRQESRDDSLHQENLELDATEVAFQTYAQLRKVRVKTAVAISAFHNMHIDICNIACSNRVNFLVLPFHMRQGHDGKFETKVSGLKEVNLKVSRDPPCSVGLLVDNGFGEPTVVSLPEICPQQIYVLFFGGPDDREALMLARRMLQHGCVKLTVIQFVIQGLGRHRLDNVRRIPSRTLMSRLQTKSASRRGWSALKRLGREVVNFFAAPWLKSKSENPKHSNDSSSESTREVDANKADGEVRVFMDNIVSQSERNMDMQALAPILAAATKPKKEEVGNSVDDDVTLHTTQGLHTTNSETQSDITHRNLALRVIETKNPEMSVLNIVNSTQPNGLIITGLHLHENSPIMQSGAFPVVDDHGLGPLGDFLVSKHHLHMKASLLVVKQHNPFQSIVSRSSRPLGSNNLHPVAEEIELSPSDSSSTPSHVDTSTTSVERDDYHRENENTDSADSEGTSRSG